MAVPVRKVSKEVQTHLDNLPSTAARIRYLASEGWTVGDIARKLDVIYQHAWNESHRKLKVVTTK
jgi:hypothetical protein